MHTRLEKTFEYVKPARPFLDSILLKTEGID